MVKAVTVNWCVCRGLEKALDQYAQPASAAPAAEADAAAAGDQKVQEAKRNSARESRKKALKNLTMPERDVLLVLGAICKVRYGKFGMSANIRSVTCAFCFLGSVQGTRGHSCLVKINIV